MTGPRQPEPEELLVALSGAASIVRKDLDAAGLQRHLIEVVRDADDRVWVGVRGEHQPSLFSALTVTEPDEGGWLVTVADRVQELVADADEYLVWPECVEHSLGVHPAEVDGVAVWTCSGDGGHVVAPIGQALRD